MPIVPTFDPLDLREAAELLQGLYRVNILELQRGVPGILGALLPGSGGPGIRRIRYIRSDPHERWQNLKGIWRRGGGDCEDLAAAGAAELTVMGIPARPVVYKVNDHLAHVVIQSLQDPRRIWDPSKVGGMGETLAGGRIYTPPSAMGAQPFARC